MLLSRDFRKTVNGIYADVIGGDGHVAVIKSMSVQPKRGRIVITSSSRDGDGGNAKPYARHVISVDDGYPLKDAWLSSVLRMIGVMMLQGRMRFVPSCSCMAHQAYLLANEAIGMSVDEANAIGSSADGNDANVGELGERWVDCFIQNVLHGHHDTSQYIMMRDSRPVNVHIVTDDVMRPMRLDVAAGTPNFMSCEQSLIAVDASKAETDDGGASDGMPLVARAV